MTPIVNIMQYLDFGNVKFTNFSEHGRKSNGLSELGSNSNPRMATEEPKNVIEVERSLYEWTIPDFGEKFPILSKNFSRNCRSAQRTNVPRFQENAKSELNSETFIRGQFVKKTSLWQLELRRSGTFLCVGLSCLKCYHDDVEEIWTKFDTDIIDFDNKCIHSVDASDHYNFGNTTKFTPHDKLGVKREAKMNGKSSFWETDMIRLTDMTQNLDTYAKRGILKLRLRLYIYNEIPTDEGKAEISNPVQVCYTESNNILVSANPFLQAVKSMWTTKQDADVTFSVEGTPIQAHKFVVSVQSPFLKKLLTEGANIQTVDVPNISLQAFEHILQYMYMQEAEIFKSCTDINCISDVLRSCYLLEMPSLAKICLVRLLTNMNVDNFGDTVCAIFDNVRQECSFYKSEVRHFLRKNQKQLLESANFKKMAKDYPDTFLELVFQPEAN